MPSGSRVNISLCDLRLRLHVALHAVIECTGQQPAEVAISSSFWSLMEDGGHLLDVLFAKDAGPADTPAHTAAL
jgi:hypothetical protein